MLVEALLTFALPVSLSSDEMLRSSKRIKHLLVRYIPGWLPDWIPGVTTKRHAVRTRALIQEVMTIPLEALRDRRVRYTDCHLLPFMLIIDHSGERSRGHLLLIKSPGRIRERETNCGTRRRN